MQRHNPNTFDHKKTRHTPSTLESEKKRISERRLLSGLPKTKKTEDANKGANFKLVQQNGF